jgi:hypothetical protein
LAFVYLIIFTAIHNLLNEMTFIVVNAKSKNKQIKKGRVLGFGLIRLILLLLFNIIAAIAFYFAYSYFESWYIKLPIIFQICYYLGRLASFPVEEDIARNLEYRYMEKLHFKTIANTILFAGLYGLGTYILNNLNKL